MITPVRPQMGNSAARRWRNERRFQSKEEEEENAPSTYNTKRGLLWSEKGTISGGLPTFYFSTGDNVDVSNPHPERVERSHAPDYVADRRTVRPSGGHLFHFLPPLCHIGEYVAVVYPREVWRIWPALRPWPAYTKKGCSTLGMPIWMAWVGFF